MMEDFETRTAQLLLENHIEQPGWVVEDLIPCCLTLFAGDPKIGKSWLGLDLALHVASGEPFWVFATAQKACCSTFAWKTRSGASRGVCRGSSTRRTTTSAASSPPGASIRV